MALTMSGLAGAWSKGILIRRNYRARVLERRNRVRAEKLARAADAASEAKSRFVAMVGHEFRTPLNAIMRYSEILQMEQGRNWSQERTAEYMADILNSARNLHRLVENVLSVTSGPDEPLMANLEKIELNSITSRIAGTNLLKADSKGIQLNQVYGADRIEVLGDHWMVAHILEELLSNALKFTPSGGRVDIEVMPRSKGGGYIRVSDDGPGIPEEMQGQVFDAFTQSDSNLSRVYGGLGLGLALVRNMTEAQGGTIRLASKPAHGTSIQVSFKPAPE